MYFSHDTDARNEDKMLGVRMELGAEGYGMYWMLLEKLAAEKTHILTLDMAKLSWDLRCDTDKLSRLINNYGLFVLDQENGQFWSEGLMNRMEKADAISNVRSEAGKAGVEAKRRKANMAKNEQNQAKNKQNTSICLDEDEQNDDLLEQNLSKIKEIKGKEIKENKIKENISSSSKPSSAEAISDADEAAGAAEEEDLEFENDLFELWEKAIKAMTRVKMPAASCHEEWETVCRMLSTPKDEDRETLISMLNEMTRNGKNGAEMVSMLMMADKKRPINEIDKRTWNAINAVCGLSSTDARQIKAAVGRDKGRWRDLVIAVEEVKRSKKIVQPARYILSKLK